MKHQQNNDKEVSAIAFMRSFDETMNLMESIGDNTAKEQKVLQESAVHMENYTDDEGVFDMESLLDVDVSDTEENQPRLYNSPEEDLTDSDKQLIVDEFAEQLSNMHEEVIDFSDVGPIATVIQDKFGFKQNLDSFLTDLMTSAADKQDSQAFAHGKPIPGVVAAEEEGGPSDITPKQAAPYGVDAGGISALGMEAGMTSYANDVAMEQEAKDDSEHHSEHDSEHHSEHDSEHHSEEEPEAETEVVDEAECEDGEVDCNKEETEETEEDVGKEGEDDLEAQLESIRSKHIKPSETDVLVDSLFELASNCSREESIDIQLEAIRTSLVENEYPSTQDQNAFEKNADSAELSAQKCADEMKDEELCEASEKEELCESSEKEELCESYEEEELYEAPDEVAPVLEAISKKYHSGENAKVNAAKAKLEAIKSEKKLDVQLESIAGNYHNGVKAKLDATKAEHKLNEKLSTLVESYHTSVKSSDDSKANLDVRKKTKAKLEELSK